MAVRSSDQITVYDLTDGYSVVLTNDSFTFAGDKDGKIATAQSTTTVIQALCGNEVPTVSVDVNAITKPTGITVSYAANTKTLTITAGTGVAAGASGTVTIPVVLDDAVTIYKTFSYAIAKTGATGGAGTAATNVIIGQEAVTIPCDKDGNTSADMTITIPFAGYQGTARKACSVAVSGLPTGITVNKNTAANTSADGSLILSVAAASGLGDTVNGEITLTFSCNSQTHVKKFSWAKSLTGATGQKGTNGTSATSVVCGNEAVSIPCTLGGLVTAASTIVIPFAGYIGTTRAACTVSYSTLPSGMSVASGNNKAATASADGSLTITVAKNATLGGAAVMTGEITLTFTCNSQTFTKKFTWSKAMTGATGAQGPQGPQGDAGEDAITLVIISSAGTVFKNTAIETTLTAHVYKAGAEVTGAALTALGTINWYKDGSSEVWKTGQTIPITAGDITNKASIEARLEA